ncbi:MAG: Fic family protein [Candidatus Aenigmarchaeota archaeon]|nr:Fic family protein [Candidatus Aenigmarchaeota archaeon]
MHLEVRTHKSNTKYYLAHSFRDKNKIRKIRIYLGQNLPKNKIKEKLKEAENKIKERIKIYRVIRDPLRTILSTEELNQIKTLEAKGRIKITHLSELEWKKFKQEFTYDTNAIEGSTVTMTEVEQILEKRQWPKEREKWEISETYGLSEAVEFLKKTREHISLSLIMEFHRLVFQNSKPYAGQLRKKGEEVVVVDGLGNIIHSGVPSILVEKMLKELIKWYGKNRRKYSPLLLAAVVHNQFETIHPFRDGNGRVGRLLLNNILLKHNLPPVNIQFKNRSGYYKAIREYQESGNIRPMIEFILMEYKNFTRKTQNR